MDHPRVLLEARTLTGERRATAADAVVARLRDWGVERVYGCGGDGLDGLLDAIRRTDGGVAFIRTRHEASAGGMAIAEAVYGDGVGVVAVAEGLGAIRLGAALREAALDRVPVVALIGRAGANGPAPELGLQALVDGVAGSRLVEASAPEQAPLAVDRAVRMAIVDRAPTVVLLPSGVRSDDAAPFPVARAVPRAAAIVESPVATAPAARLREAAIVLSHAKRPMILVGRGAAGEGEAIAALARRLGAGVVTSLRGKSLIDERLPFVAGTMGPLGTTASAELLADCDALLIVGSSASWADHCPAATRAVQIDLDAAAIGSRAPVEVGLVSGAGAALESLVEMLPEPLTNGWWSRVHDAVAGWHERAAARAAIEVDGANPDAAIRSLQAHLRPGMRLALDVGRVVASYAGQLAIPRDVPVHLPGGPETTGGGVPSGIAAKLGAPEHPAVVLTDDRAMQLSGLAELATVADRWRQWRDPRFIVAVFHDAASAVPFAAYARLLGLDGLAVETSRELDGAWRRAFSADRPAVLQIRTGARVEG